MAHLADEAGEGSGGLLTFGHGEMSIAHTKHIQGLLNLGSEQPILHYVSSFLPEVKEGR